MFFQLFKIVLLPGVVLLGWVGSSVIFAATNTTPNLIKQQKPVAHTKRAKSLSLVGVQNVFRMSDKLVTGSQPEGDKAFKALAVLGVKTIITVDGARPDIERARKYGMRYVQIPFGYDGLPRDRSLSIARAVRELPGLIYLHCHHGKHRSPVAAACVMIANDNWNNDDALAFLKRAGTGGNYSGLWDDVRHYQKPEQDELNQASNDFPAVARTDGLVQSMVRLDELVGHLQAAQKSAWAKPTEHPDLDPPHEALMLREAYTELQREEDTKGRPQKYRFWLSESEKQSRELENALRDGKRAEADAAFQKVTANCQSCHAVFRNVPQKGKSK